MKTKVVITDGGRKDAGFSGTTGDCACRAAAVASGMEYQTVYDLINRFAEGERKGKKKRGISNARTGVYRQCMHKLMAHLGATWTPTMKIGQGCKVHVRADELPSGSLVLNLSGHYAAFVDGVLYDNHDSSRDGTRCVYGYWKFPESEGGAH